eukprot:CAMPEP_0183559062 /NCGR_PEP_ID=MMETSP0371-20130417/90572_1 /TAXON_ID=268820 /ORGANISM="Peridinium aciculiferum, Strain PAER-2" /LENGTH=271 /DNA_ID=CAMNT_0025766723 /DNA_START=149 /DNA_END=965 /DNA_ORIENTATION=+
MCSQLPISPILRGLPPGVDHLQRDPGLGQESALALHAQASALGLLDGFLELLLAAALDRQLQPHHGLGAARRRHAALRVALELLDEGEGTLDLAPVHAASSAKNRARRKASSSRLAMAAASASRAILLLEVRVASSVASASSKAARPAALPSARARWMASSSASSSAQTFPKLSRATRCARVSPGLGVLGVGRGVEPVRCRFDLPLGDLEPVSTMNLSIPAAASSLCCGVRSLLQTQLAVSPMAPNTGCQAQQATPNHAMFSIDGCAPGFP